MTTKDFVNKIAESAAYYPDSTFAQRGKVNTCVNPYSYHIFKKNNKLYRQMDGLYVDGMTMCLFIRLYWGKRVPRLSFDMSGMAVDLFDRLNSPGNNETIYFIGAKQEEIEGTMEHIRASYPNMKVKGFRNGYFKTPGERAAAIAEIVRLNPDFAIIGMGSPLQERFAIDLRDAGFKGTSFTCGGFLHQTAKSIYYYPDWVNRMNLRAFWRLAHERGMVKRLFNVLVQFPILFTIDKLKSTVGK